MLLRFHYLIRKISSMSLLAIWKSCCSLQHNVTFQALKWKLKTYQQMYPNLLHIRRFIQIKNITWRTYKYAYLLIMGSHWLPMLLCSFPEQLILSSLSCRREIFKVVKRGTQFLQTYKSYNMPTVEERKRKKIHISRNKKCLGRFVFWWQQGNYASPEWPVNNFINSKKPILSG